MLAGCHVESVAIKGGRAAGVFVKNGWSRHFYPADLVVLAAGGFETAAILDRSGITCEERLFVDPVLCVAAKIPDFKQHSEVTMPFVSILDHIILSPYFDHLSFFFNKKWRTHADNIASIMIKLADDDTGSVSRNGVKKTLTDQDLRSLDKGVEVCKEILRRSGASDKKMFLGTVIAGHPGGTLPLTKKETTSFHSERLPENLFAADASLLPKSLGNPPILTIIAMAKRVSRICQSLSA